MTEWIRSKSADKIRGDDDQFEEAYGLPMGFGPSDDGGESDC